MFKHFVGMFKHFTAVFKIFYQMFKHFRVNLNMFFDAFQIPLIFAEKWKQYPGIHLLADESWIPKYVTYQKQWFREMFKRF